MHHHLGKLTALSAHWSAAPAPLPCSSALRHLSLLAASTGVHAPAAHPFSSAWLAGVKLQTMALTERPGGPSLFPLDLRCTLWPDSLSLIHSPLFIAMNSGALRLDEWAMAVTAHLCIRRKVLAPRSAP